MKDWIEQMTSRETDLIRAAERRKNVATAEGRGLRLRSNEPHSGERFFRPCRGSCSTVTQHHGLQPWLRSYAAPRLNPEFSK
jgi:hypothetical protein